MVYPFTNPTDKNSNDNMNYNMGAKTVILVLVVIAISAVTFFVIRGGESSSEDLLITQTPIGSDKPTNRKIIRNVSKNSLCKIATTVGVSDVAIKKHLLKHGYNLSKGKISLV